MLTLAAFALVAPAARDAADDRRPPSPDLAFEVPPIPPEVARPFSFGFHSELADLAFIEAIQIYGSRPKVGVTYRQTASSDRLLARLLQYTVDLDPLFRGAYRFTGNALPHHTLDGKVTGVIDAERILVRGVRERPDDWRIHFLLGFIRSFYLGDLIGAARELGEAARIPGSPRYVGLLATRLSADAGDLDDAEAFAAAMEDQASEPQTKEEWHARIVDLHMERDLRALEKAIKRYAEREHRKPGALVDLVRAGDLSSIPDEPHGGHYVMDGDGGVRSDSAQRLRFRGRKGTQAELEIR